MAGPSLVIAILGAWLSFAPWILSFSSRAASNNAAIGPVVITLALCSAASPRSHVFAGLNALIGAGVFVSPWLLGFSNEPAATWNSVIVGGFIVLFALARAAAVVPASLNDQSPLE